MRWSCDDERQRRQHRHTAVSPPDTRTNRLSRAECCRRRGIYTGLSRASAERRFAVCPALSASEPRRERCVTPPSHQRAAWIFIPLCVGNFREQASHLCASFRASTSASVVELTRVLRFRGLYARPYSWPAISQLLHQ